MGSNSGLFRAPGFIISPVGKRERRAKKEKGERKEGKGEWKRKGRKEGRRSKERSEAR